MDKKTVDFLLINGASGIDIDIPFYGATLPEKSPLNVALCIPYALNSYTINCPFTFDGKKWTRTCKRECLILKLYYKNEETEVPFFQKGKVFYTTTLFKKTDFFNRIVYFEWNL